MRTLIITIGPPGAGKSTWADKCLSLNTLRLERDRFREAMWGSREAYHRDPTDPEVKSKTIGMAMFGAAQAWPWERDIAITDTGTAHNPRFWKLRPRHELVVFDVPVEVLRERNRTRQENHRVSDDVLDRFIRAYQDKSAWWRHTQVNSITIIRPDETIRNAHVRMLS